MGWFNSSSLDLFFAPSKALQEKQNPFSSYSRQRPSLGLLLTTRVILISPTSCAENLFWEAMTSLRY